MSYKDWKLKALTDIWTGDADGKANRLIPTGLMGSIRWWFEVLVRGLGGTACDPTSPVRCPDHKKNPTEPGHHCVVCELFGCTGWARKFRLMVMDTGGNVIQNKIAAGTTFTLRSIPLRPIRDEEWCLLNCTLRLIADYGAIGGKTVLKPSDEKGRENQPHHKDYGLIQYLSGPSNQACDKRLEEIREYVRSSNWRSAAHEYEDDEGQRHDFSWASLQNFWCVKGRDRYLARDGKKKSTFNAVVGRKADKSVKEKKGNRVIRWTDLLEDPNDPVAVWLAGRHQESKKVFSFKHPVEGPRTFGFVKPGVVDFDGMKKRLQQVWHDLKDEDFLTGEQVLAKLLRQSGGCR